MPAHVFLINREVSWLSFNERVLQEAEDNSVPLLERFRFLGIYSNNLDEFYRVRVAAVRRMMKHGKKGEEFLGESPAALYDRIQQIIIRQQARFESTYRKLLRELEKSGALIVNEKQLNREQSEVTRQYFRESVMPALFPIMVDSAPQFPYMKDRAIYLLVRIVRREKENKYRYALIEIPSALPRFFRLPDAKGKRCVILLDDVIRHCLNDVFPFFEYDTIDAFTIKMTRDAELETDNDISKGLLEKLSKSLKKRRKGFPVRFIFDVEIPKDALQFLQRKLPVLKDEYLVPGGRYHNFRDFIKFPDLGLATLKYKEEPPARHPVLRREKSFIRVLRNQDILLMYPYQSFNHTIDLLREASMDPKVTAVSITLYRAARNSNVVNALINAARNGKKVNAVVELQARFDEEANIFWSNQLKEEGVNVIYGVPGFKVHSKLILIHRKEKDKTARYAHVGTGNFNEDTSGVYSDFSLFTADKKLAKEVEEVFRFYFNNNYRPQLEQLLVAPFNLRKRLMRLIDGEISEARAGRRAEIFLKMNSLVDSTMIRRLYEASRAGVKIRLIIRGICSLVTGTLHQSENIEAISIVDRYLEHGRVFIFHQGGKERIYLSSADWMTRNLDFRSEVAMPVLDPRIAKTIKQTMEIQWSDNTKARILTPMQENTYVKAGEKPSVRSQSEIYQYLTRSTQSK
ncbi:MAG: polyphosphate kinase 1 [Bacteroidia bacterium]|nr:polyphosphate kinase 1 [Bacteroidia bacterium]